LVDFHFHDLRHTFASWLAMNGTMQKGLMELLGHRNSKMTERYTHLSDEYWRKAIASLPSLRKVFEGRKPRLARSAK
jgi:integrase